MGTQALVRERPAEWLARALVTGLVAATAMLAAFLLAYALAALFAGIEASSTASAQHMQAWFRAATRNPLVDTSQSTVYLLVAAQVALALAGAVVYAAYEPHWSGQSWARGLGFALLLWLIAVAVLLPLAGGGFLGIALGAGPLPLLGTLLAYLAYGAVLGTVYGPLGDTLLGPATDEDTQAIGRTAQLGAGGLVVGALLGALGGLALSQVVAPSFGLPPVALVLALALVGGGWGQAIGALVGLPGAPAEARTAAVHPVVAPAPTATAWPLLRQLRVVAVNGACQRGYQVGDAFNCTPAGEVGPALCPAAAHALRPLVAAMVQGRADAPRSVACPIYEHQLVFQLEAVAVA